MWYGMFFSLLSTFSSGLPSVPTLASGQTMQPSPSRTRWLNNVRVCVGGNEVLQNRWIITFLKIELFFAPSLFHFGHM